ncbi:MAG: sporulation protein [Acidimicrobiales bacterium]
MAVTTGTAPTALGGTVRAVVTITGDLDRKVRGAKVQLVRTGLHRYTNVDVIGHGYHDSLSHEEVVTTEVPIISSDGKVVQGEHVVSLHVPEDGLPSATDQVKWSVRAIIERRHGLDVKAEAPIEVLAGPERFASEASAEARYKGERCIDLELSTRTLRPGETITGNIVLRPTRAMTVTKVVVTFTVTMPVKKGLEGKAVAPQSLLHEPLDLQPGDTRNVSFDLTLPADAAPTVRGGMTTPPCHSIISWDVGAEAECAFSADDKTTTDGFVYLGINVYNTDVAPPASAR